MSERRYTLEQLQDAAVQRELLATLGLSEPALPPATDVTPSEGPAFTLVAEAARPRDWFSGKRAPSVAKEVNEVFADMDWHASRETE